MSSSIPQGDTARGTARMGPYLWVVLSLITGAALTNALMRQGLPVLYPFIQSDFGLSRAQVGFVTSALAVGSAVVAVLAGWLTDTFGVKRMIVITLFTMTAFTLAFPLAYSFPVVLVLAVCIGIASSPLHPTTAQAVMDWFPVRVRASAMSLKQTGVPVAGALTAAVLPAIALAMGWRMAAAIAGLLILAIAVVFALLYRDAPRGIQAERKFDLATLKGILRNRCLMINIIWGSTFVGFQFVVVSYFMLFTIEELQLSPIKAGGLLAIAQVSSIFARVLWGMASDFIFRGHRIIVLVIVGFLTVLWMLGASLITTEVHEALIYLIAIVIGMSTMSYHGVYFALIGEQADKGHLGVTIGVSSTLNHVGQMALTPLFGYLVDISSSYSLAWRVAAAAALVSTLALLAFRWEPQRH